MANSIRIDNDTMTEIKFIQKSIRYSGLLLWLGLADLPLSSAASCRSNSWALGRRIVARFSYQFQLSFQ